MRRIGRAFRRRLRCVEQLAQDAAALAKLSERNGLPLDPVEAVRGSRAYQALPGAAQQAFGSVYQELSGCSSFVPAPAPEVGSPPRLEPEAALSRLSRAIQRQIGKARRHGPGFERVSRNGPDYVLEDHPEDLIRHAHALRMREDERGPYALVTYSDEELGATRTGYLVAKADLNDETFGAALWKVLAGKLPGYHLRVQSEEAFQRAAPATIFPAGAPEDPLAERKARLEAAGTFLKNNAASHAGLRGKLSEAWVGTSELQPHLFVRTTLGRGQLEEQRDSLESAITVLLKAGGFRDVLCPVYFCNNIGLLPESGGPPV